MYDLQLLGKSLEEFNKDVGILYDKIWENYCLDLGELLLGHLGGFGHPQKN